MKIKFQTKAQSNLKQKKDFLSLKPEMRVIYFYRMMERLKDFPTKKKENNNFKIVID
ncbi:MAG: hypothetical protein ACPG44_03800 [Polaribacter sp.]